MGLSTQHLTGFFIGLGAAAGGFYLYKKNQQKVDEFLAKQGIKVPGAKSQGYASMSLENLVNEKEQLEDLIAERELQAQTSEEGPAENAT